LEWIDGAIWANIWLTNKIAIIDPTSGWVVRWIDVTKLTKKAAAGNQEAVPNGIALNRGTGQLIFTGKLWSKAFLIQASSIEQNQG
jgi:glutaminyl-peptide cyclotransferase